MNIHISGSFDYKKILKFTFPSVIMMVFTSIYGVVDGFFVSNFVGKTPFAAINFIYPLIMLIGALGFMFGAGGTALISKTMGEGNEKKANGLFSLIVYTSIASGVLATIVSLMFLRPAAIFLGAEGQLLNDAVTYGRILLVALPFFMLQFEFQNFFIAAEKAHLGLWVTVASGVSNMVFDALFMAVFSWGVVGAALATALSQVVGGVIPLVYFSKKNTSLLKLGKPDFDFKALLKTVSNGSSELMTNISLSLINILYNLQLIKYAGENGLAAYGVIMYVNFIFLSVFIGFSNGIAPVVGYNFGAKNYGELKGLRKKSFVIITVFSVLMFILAELLAYPLSYIYIGYDKILMDITLRGFLIYSLSFLFSGFAIFGSAFFTALNDGLTSALISFLRTLLFQAAAVMIFPIFLKTDGIWFSVVAAEFMAVVLTFGFIKLKKNVYNY